AIRQRRRHAVCHAAIALAITGGEDRPSRRDSVFAETAIENQLVGRRRDRWRSGGDFVEEQNAGRAVAFFIGQHRRYGPFDDVAYAKRNAATIGRFHLREPHVDHRHVVTRGHLCHHLRLAHTWRTPQHY